MKFKIYPDYLLIIIGFVVCSCSGNKPVQEAVAVQSGNIRDYLIKSAKDLTDQSLSGIKTRDDLENDRPARYTEFLEMLSLQDMPVNGERTPSECTHYRYGSERRISY